MSETRARDLSHTATLKQNGGPIAGAAVCDDFKRVVYADFFSRHAAKPKGAVPRRRRRRESVSGTAAAVAVPLISTRTPVGLTPPCPPVPLFTKKARVFCPGINPLLIVKG
jgi:hypothetical protein